MKHFLKLLLPLLVLAASPVQANECLELANYEMNANYDTGRGCQDGVFNAVSSSMLGWGVGLFVGIALLTGLVHNAHVDVTDTSSSNSSN